jgi:hypothetical protein
LVFLVQKYTIWQPWFVAKKRQNKTIALSGAILLGNNIEVTEENNPKLYNNFRCKIFLRNKAFLGSSVYLNRHRA